MEYTVELFVDFLKEIESYSTYCESIRYETQSKLSLTESRCEEAILGKKRMMETSIYDFSNEKQNLLKRYEENIQKIENGDFARRDAITQKIIQCRESLGEIEAKTKENKKNLSASKELNDEITSLTKVLLCQ